MPSYRQIIRRTQKQVDAEKRAAAAEAKPKARKPRKPKAAAE